jgi:hypothetical protein
MQEQEPEELTEGIQSNGAAVVMKEESEKGTR